MCGSWEKGQTVVYFMRFQTMYFNMTWWVLNQQWNGNHFCISTMLLKHIFASQKKKIVAIMQKLSRKKIYQKLTAKLCTVSLFLMECRDINTSLCLDAPSQQLWSVKKARAPSLCDRQLVKYPQRLKKTSRNILIQSLTISGMKLNFTSWYTDDKSRDMHQLSPSYRWDAEVYPQRHILNIQRHS